MLRICSQVNTNMCAPSDVAGWGDALLPSPSSSLAGIDGVPPLIALSYMTDQQPSTVLTGAPWFAAVPCTTRCCVGCALVCRLTSLFTGIYGTHPQQAFTPALWHGAKFGRQRPEAQSLIEHPASLEFAAGRACRASGAGLGAAALPAAPAAVLPAAGGARGGPAGQHAGRAAAGVHQSAARPRRAHALQGPPRGGLLSASRDQRPGAHPAFGFHCYSYLLSLPAEALITAFCAAQSGCH